MTYVVASACVDVKDRACEPVCPAEAIFSEDDVPEAPASFTRINAEFFDELGSADGATGTDWSGTDHPDIAVLVEAGESR